MPAIPIAPDGWREALGAIDRAGDWSAFFARELSAHPWREVLDVWVARLAPGIFAGATHGILRTAHAVRALQRTETPQRVRELGRAWLTGPPATVNCPQPPLGGSVCVPTMP